MRSVHDYCLLNSQVDKDIKRKNILLKKEKINEISLFQIFIMVFIASYVKAICRLHLSVIIRIKWQN